VVINWIQLIGGALGKEGKSKVNILVLLKIALKSYKCDDIIYLAVVKGTTYRRFLVSCVTYPNMKNSTRVLSIFIIKTAISYLVLHYQAFLIPNKHLIVRKN